MVTAPKAELSVRHHYSKLKLKIFFLCMNISMNEFQLDFRFNLVFLYSFNDTCRNFGKMCLFWQITRYCFAIK